MESTVRTSWVEGLFGALDHVFPDIRTIDGQSTDPVVTIDGRPMLLFCSPNYLGLSNDTRLQAVAAKEIARSGVGTNGSGIVSGYTDAHQEVEECYAEFMGTQSALYYNAVSDASCGVLGSIVSPPLVALFKKEIPYDLSPAAVFCDEQNHASLVDAVRLARPDKTYVYRHCDMSQLEKCLRLSNHRRKVILTDGYFSMSAAIAPLREIVSLARRYDAVVVVDDAHGTGVLGESGRGSAEYWGVEKDIAFLLASAGKALGVRGGLVGGSEEQTRYLRVSSRRYMFSGTLPAAIPRAVTAALRIAQEESWRRARVLAFARHLREGLQSMGYTVLGDHHIVPWLVGNDKKADLVSQELERRGIMAASIRYPAVKAGQAIIRFMPMATHSLDHITEVLDACRAAGRFL